MSRANLRIVRNNEEYVPKETTAFTKEAHKISDGAFVVKTTRKKSIRTNTHKLINKAVANIQAVEKGTF
tara:strand:- start:328 stop:534 length:207 start_codon:yes stop_codon:yes gene_type:complete